MLDATAGDVVERLGIRTAWPVTMVVLTAASWSLAAFPGNAAVAWTAAAVFGTAYIALTGLLLVWGTDVYPHAPATGVGLAFLLIALGQAIGAPLIGVIEETAGARTAFGAAALLALAGGLVRPAGGGPVP